MTFSTPEDGLKSTKTGMIVTSHVAHGESESADPTFVSQERQQL